MKCIQPYGQAQLLSLIARSLSRTAQRGLWFMNFMVYLLAIFTAHCPPMTYRFINYLTVVFTSSLSRRSSHTASFNGTIPGPTSKSGSGHCMLKCAL